LRTYIVPILFLSVRYEVACPRHEGKVRSRLFSENKYIYYDIIVSGIKLSSDSEGPSDGPNPADSDILLFGVSEDAPLGK